MRKSLLRTAALVAAVLAVGAASAMAVRLQVGNIVVEADGGFSPTTLPKKGFAPIEVFGHARISTADGELPPALRTITLYFDRNGEVETRGLPRCTRGQLVATTSRVARQKCRAAIIGSGFGKGVVKFSEQPAIPASSPITLFNAPPRNGNPVVLAHAHLTVPAPTTYIVPVEIEKVNRGRYGFRTVAKIPPIASGAGIPLYGTIRIGREWTHRGKRLSYANAGCPDGRLQARGEFGFSDGTTARGDFLRRCKSR